MKLGFFFGAGAEIGYGLPSGGKFAIDLFRQDVGAQKERLRTQLSQIDKLTPYATQWLPNDFDRKRIHAFGKNEFTNLIESSIEYRKSEIIRRLNNFDNEADAAIEKLGIDKDDIIRRFNDEMPSRYGEHLYSTAVRLNPVLSREVNLFASEFYSAVLSILSGQGDAGDLQRYAGAFLQLLVGSHGEDLVQRLNQEIFESAPDDIPIFDDVTGMFRLEFNRVGMTALELLLDPQSNYDLNDGTLIDQFSAINQVILENIFTTVLDYQSLIDSHFRYLFAPRAEWAKFTKMVIFLRSAREYIVEQLPDPADLPSEGYYHDLKRCVELGIEIGAIGTSNYNSLIEQIAESGDLLLPEVKHLNGSVNDYYNPYKNSVVSSIATDTTRDQIYVPFILTQSGLKPLTSIEMSRRYVDLYDDYVACDGIVVIGYAFNIDDSHINGIFRQLIERERKTIYWISLFSHGPAEEQKRDLCKRLRIDAQFREQIQVVLVHRESRNCDGDVRWINEVNRLHAAQVSTEE